MLICFSATVIKSLSCMAWKTNASVSSNDTVSVRTLWLLMKLKQDSTGLKPVCQMVTETHDNSRNLAAAWGLGGGKLRGGPTQSRCKAKCTVSYCTRRSTLALNREGGKRNTFQLSFSVISLHLDDDFNCWTYEEKYFLLMKRFPGLIQHYIIQNNQ